MSIIVAGAGTAGWITALYMNKIYPEKKVIVIHDNKTPIIGVGEGTTPHFRRMMNLLNIKIEDLIEQCEVTFKQSIRFTNWKGDGTHYHHSFTDFTGQLEHYFTAYSHGVHVDQVEALSMLSELKKVCATREAIEEGQDPYYDCDTSLHFNARKLAEYLQSVGEGRGVKTVIGKIEDAILDENDYVSEIVLDTKQRIQTDFIFDCTGFARFFVNKIYKSPITSYEKILPVKRAMPFFLEKNEPTPPYTEAIAMKYGWVWKIPVGKRYGCGYVYDSDLITDEQAYEEICQLTGQRPDVPRKLAFKPEFNTKPLNKNTLALGLAHGFLEPLEATSIMLTIIMLGLFYQDFSKENIFDRSTIESVSEKYNEKITNMVDNCVIMIYIHYLTPRNDTEFWRNFKKNIPENVGNTLKEIYNYDIENPSSIKDGIPFNIFNLIKCMAGVGHLNPEVIEKNKNKNGITLQQIKDRISVISEICDISENHDEYINMLSNT